MRADGHGPTHIADALGISKMSVWRALNSAAAWRVPRPRVPRRTASRAWRRGRGRAAGEAAGGGGAERRSAGRVRRPAWHNGDVNALSLGGFGTTRSGVMMPSENIWKRGLGDCRRCGAVGIVPSEGICIAYHSPWRVPLAWGAPSLRGNLQNASALELEPDSRLWREALKEIAAMRRHEMVQQREVAEMNNRQ
jgi:hypothetical protein